MKTAIAVSGGTDSLFALLSLLEEGHDVTAVHARFIPSPPGGSPVPALEELCARLGVRFRVADLTEDFRTHVMTPFAEEHARCRTPNPCALCNRAMKFGRLLDFSLQDCDVYATGHYASMDEHPLYGRTLHTGADGSKDQSYFLALVPIERLRRCVFPLAARTKTAIRAWLAERGHTPPLPSESQEICFIPGDDHCAWLLERQQEGLITLPGPGPAVLSAPGEEEGRIIARHQGLWRYTEGQRRGLGIPWKEPLYALRRDAASNTLSVGPKEMLATAECTASQANLMVPPDLWPDRLLVRIRYRQKPVPAAVTARDGRLLIRFGTPQLPPAPGQIAAVYDEDGFVLAGGILD
ncbi:MAG: tRNA-specific 2-thiouridylase [Mailhella sp.]|nr:tRNA-specific 2-thiouridylase [Mailhella sp.]